MGRQSVLEGAAWWREVLLETGARVMAAGELVRDHPEVGSFTEDEEAALAGTRAALERIAENVRIVALDQYDDGA